MGPRTDALKAAIDEAWRVFDTPAPATIGVCTEPCCMDPRIAADFLKRKARDLPADYIRDWNSAAFADDIGHNHVAWLLPRVMEMLAEGEIVGAALPATFDRLPLTGFPAQWHPDEVIAVQRFAERFFAALLANELPIARPDIDAWLCMFGLGGADVAPLLAQMAALPDQRLIAALHVWWVLPFGRRIAVSPFWDGSPAHKQVWNWYTSQALLARMHEAALAGNEKAQDLYVLIAASSASDAP